MTNFKYSNVDNISKADIILIGVADESKSHAIRKGTSRGPDVLRSLTNEVNFFSRNGNTIPISSMYGSISNKNIFDYGNVDREELYNVIYNISSLRKIPITIGGDHSITSIIIKAIGDVHGKIGLLYYDAHPDFVSSTKNYYGSVLTDSFNYIDIDKSLLIGIRAAESEEIKNLTESGLRFFSPIDIDLQGTSKILKEIQPINKNEKKYISVDLDCLDPAFAPGVSVPSSGGLSTVTLLSLITSAISFGILGLDIMEFVPDHDINNLTAFVASRLILESIGSIPQKNIQ